MIGWYSEGENGKAMLDRGDPRVPEGPALSFVLTLRATKIRLPPFIGSASLWAKVNSAVIGPHGVVRYGC